MQPLAETLVKATTELSDVVVANDIGTTDTADSDNSFLGILNAGAVALRMEAPAESVPTIGNTDARGDSLPPSGEVLPQAMPEIAGMSFNPPAPLVNQGRQERDSPMPDKSLDAASQSENKAPLRLRPPPAAQIPAAPLPVTSTPRAAEPVTPMPVVTSPTAEVSQATDAHAKSPDLPVIVARQISEVRPQRETRSAAPDGARQIVVSRADAEKPQRPSTEVPGRGHKSNKLMGGMQQFREPDADLRRRPSSLLTRTSSTAQVLASRPAVKDATATSPEAPRQEAARRNEDASAAAYTDARKVLLVPARNAAFASAPAAPTDTRELPQQISELGELSKYTNPRRQGRAEKLNVLQAHERVTSPAKSGEQVRPEQQVPMSIREVRTLAPLAPAHPVSNLHAVPGAMPASSSSLVPTPVPPAVMTLDTPVLDPAWADAVRGRVLMLASANVRSAEIRLNPAELGPLQVQIAVDDGVVDVTFGAAHSATREALETALPRLKDLLSENGMSLAGASVTDGEVASRGDDSKQGTLADVEADDGKAIASAEEPAMQIQARTQPKGLVDTFV